MEFFLPSPLFLSYAALAVLVVLPVLYCIQQLIQNDYKAFIALGPGGTPQTFVGYLRICFLRIFALSDTLTPPEPPSRLRPRSGVLKGLPKRGGPRPRVVGLAPHRQMNQRGSPEMYAQLGREMEDLVNRHPERLFSDTSCFEKHSFGIFTFPCAYNRETCSGEVVHGHPSDGSMHLTLHPADVKVVLELGWGERQYVFSELLRAQNNLDLLTLNSYTALLHVTIGGGG